MNKKIFILITSISLCGCRASTDIKTTALTNRSNAVIRQGTINNYKRESPYTNDDLVDSTSEFDKNTTLTERRAKKIAHAVTKIERIDKASVVLNSNSAIIGIEVSGELDDARLINLKKEVEKEVRLVDKDLDRIAVTASKELVERVSKMADFVSGEPEEEKGTQSLNKETKEIIQKLTPQF